MKSFNINMPVMFKPTEYGREYYRKKRMKLQDDINKNGSGFEIHLELKINDEGWCEMQMHDFMGNFGDAMCLGGKPVIEMCEIVFYDKDLTEFENINGFEKLVD